MAYQQLSPAKLDYFFTTFETRFWMAIKNAPRWSDKVVTRYNSTSQTILHGWMGMVQNMRIWDGPRVVRQPAPQTYAVPMLPWEGTNAIDQFTLMTDQWGIYYPLAQRMGDKAGKLQDYALRDLIQGRGKLGTAPWQTGADGVTQWSTSHPVNFWDASMGTYANNFGTGGVVVDGVTVGGTFSTNAYVTLWQYQSAIKNESNEAMGAIPDRLMVPSQLRFPAAVILQTALFSPPQLGSLGSGSGANAPFVGNMTNILNGSADILWTPDLNDQPTAFFLMDTSGPMMPFGYAVHTDPQFVIRNSPTDPEVFDNHRYLYGTWAYSTPHWGLPWQVMRSGI